MFRPTYRFTPFLLKCLEGISSQKVILEQIGRRSSQVKMSVARDSFNRSVHSSTWIEGNTLSLAQVAALAADRGVVTAEKQQKLEVQNCIEAMRWAIKSSHKDLNSPKLLKLHVLMTKGILPAVKCGRYRKVQNYIVNARNQVVFTPPAPAKINQRIRGLFTWLKVNRKEHAIVRSAIFHHEFVTIHPFVDGNGRVTRAASQWILFEDGYDPAWTLALDEYFARDRVKYYDMIQQTRDLDGDYTYWVEYVAQGLLEAIGNVAERLKVVCSGSKARLTPKQTELVGLLEKRGSLSSAAIGQEMNINRARVNQLIQPLVKAKIVAQEGVTKGAKYSLA